MELLILIILYYLSQNPDFERSVKPLLGELKNSEQALKFLEELSQFSHLFSGLNSKNGGGMSGTNAQHSPKPNTSQSNERTEKNPQPPHGESDKKGTSSNSPTAGIADGFIEELLSKYFYTEK
jgi:hypothetical protein